MKNYCSWFVFGVLAKVIKQSLTFMDVDKQQTLLLITCATDTSDTGKLHLLWHAILIGH